MWKTGVLGMLVMLGAATQAIAGGRGDVQTAPPPGYRIELTFSSSVPDGYYVLSGPAASYARYPLNHDLRKALEGYRARSEGPPGAVPVRLGVHLESVSTDYHELGADLGRGGLRLAAFPGVRRANGDSDWDGPSIPEEITKSVVLMMEVEVAGPARAPRKVSLHASASEVVRRDQWDRWAYDYRGVLSKAVRNAVVEVDRVVRRALE